MWKAYATIVGTISAGIWGNLGTCAQMNQWRHAATIDLCTESHEGLGEACAVGLFVGREGPRTRAGA